MLQYRIKILEINASDRWEDVYSGCSSFSFGKENLEDLQRIQARTGFETKTFNKNGL